MEQAQVFGKYQLVRPLATGGMAEVFVAAQLGPGGVTRDVVLKRVLPELSSKLDFVTMFLDEARLAARLSHPNVVQLFDFGQENGSYFLVLEYLDGADVDTLLRLALQRRRQVPERIAALIIAQACDGLQYVHSLAGPDGKPLNIIHRDVSPSNLFVTFQGTVKLLDFGIAKAESNLSQTQAGQTKGKIAYMSPEQLLHEPLTPGSDLFALGICFYELLAGLGLFYRPDSGAMMRAVLTEEIKPPSTLRPGLSPPLEAIVMRALSRDPAERYASAADMRAEIDTFLSGLPFIAPADALRDYLKELVELEPSGKLPTRSLQAAFTDPALVPAGGVGGQAFDSATTSLGGLVPTVGTGKTLAAGWRRGLPVLVGLPVVLLLGFGLQRWHAHSVAARAKMAESAKPVVAAHHPPALSPVPEPAPTHTAARSHGKSARQNEMGAGVGILEVSCVPSCHVFVDGVQAGESPPTNPIYLPQGHHSIRAVELHGGKERTAGVTVKAGKHVLRNIHF